MHSFYFLFYFFRLKKEKKNVSERREKKFLRATRRSVECSYDPHGSVLRFFQSFNQKQKVSSFFFDLDETTVSISKMMKTGGGGMRETGRLPVASDGAISL